MATMAVAALHMTVRKEQGRPFRVSIAVAKNECVLVHLKHFKTFGDTAMSNRELKGSDAAAASLDEVSGRTRKTLLLRVKNPDDKKAWNTFYTRYNTLIRDSASSYCFANHLALTRDDIEEVVQNVMLNINSDIGDFEYKPGNRAFRKFLITVTRRRCIDYVRTKICRPDLDVRKAPKGADDDRSGDTFDRRVTKKTGDITKMIAENNLIAGRDLALEKLRVDPTVTLHQFQIFEMLVMGKAVADVCAQLDIKPGTIYTIRTRVTPHYEKALRAAKKELDSPAELPPSLPKGKDAKRT